MNLSRQASTNLHTFFIVLFWLAASGAANAQYIWINVSFKVVLNPVDGARPGGASDAAIQSGISRINELLDSYGRGYRLRLVDPIISIGGPGQTAGPSQWFATDFFDEANGNAWKRQMQSAATDNPVTYAWNVSAINIYVTDGICGGKCSFPDSGDDIIVIGGCSAGDGEVQLHEIGHYFGLYHTQGKACGHCGDGPGECSSPGSDEISDTLKDLPCWNRDQIAQQNDLGPTYGSLTAADQLRVDDVFFNLMSYHFVKVNLTERQMDRWTDIAKVSRRGVCSGSTVFVDGSNRCEQPNGTSEAMRFPFVASCLFGPYPNLTRGLEAASASNNDIILIRPGHYPENLIITKPVTLRATRAGGVTIGQ